MEVKIWKFTPVGYFFFDFGSGAGSCMYMYYPNTLYVL